VLTGTVTAQSTGGGTPIPADGAVLVAHGSQAPKLQAETPPGTDAETIEGVSGAAVKRLCGRHALQRQARHGVQRQVVVLAALEPA